MKIVLPAFLFLSISLIVPAGAQERNRDAAPAEGAEIAQDTGAQKILARYQELRPDNDELAMYQLDWAPSLKRALKRAEKESRPIFLVVIHAQYGDILSGHC